MIMTPSLIYSLGLHSELLEDSNVSQLCLRICFKPVSITIKMGIFSQIHSKSLICEQPSAAWAPPKFNDRGRHPSSMAEVSDVTKQAGHVSPKKYLIIIISTKLSQIINYQKPKYKDK
jgi:hypothetical protein